ncbi:MAG: 30S ribosomal protein S4 [Candidatus Aerophobetes bacterium]|nr:30S ribosomal protein S4 [Candidatus Aerophobetes bacterium]
MGRDIENKCKRCRQLNTKLFLKGERCYTSKCALEKRKARKIVRRDRFSQYKQQLEEKQKLKWMYGLLEGQFKRHYRMAEKSPNITGEELLRILERRLDNVVYRLGFAFSRPQARQLINHGHFLVNGHKVDIPSYLLKEGEVIEVRGKSRKLPLIKQAIDSSSKKALPEWLEMDKESLKGIVRRFPEREELDQRINLPLIVEYYSR